MRCNSRLDPAVFLMLFVASRQAHSFGQDVSQWPGEMLGMMHMIVG
jgi:hypothetical protein